MFERFTDTARRVVVLAQEEARLHGHNYIGSEHILLGLLREEEALGAKALTSLGVSLMDARKRVELIIGAGPKPITGHVPFTPRAKKILALALREALNLGHNYIGTEHLLLGLLREGEGVACQVLTELGVGLDAARQRVIELMSGMPEAVREGPPTIGLAADAEATPWRPVTMRADDPAATPFCPGCRKSLTGALRGRRIEMTEDGGRTREVFVLYCGTCGYAIDLSLPNEEPNS